MWIIQAVVSHFRVVSEICEGRKQEGTNSAEVASQRFAEGLTAGEPEPYPYSPLQPVEASILPSGLKATLDTVPE
jgi:hypothetical protein